jgi:ABC-type antimicrobial peptide transport system permease subunit
MREIVGIVGDAEQMPLGAESDAIYYFPYKQLPWGIGTIVLRTAVPPREVESAAQAVLASIDRQVPIHRVRTGEQLAATALARMQFLIVLMGSFAAIALLLTGAGLYGVVSYSVARRRGEIGVRIAIGAGRGQVLGMVFQQAMRLVAVGVILGLAFAAAGGRVLAKMTYGIRPAEPLVLVIACSVLVLTGVAAAYVPAARAASVDPIQALRSE